MRRAPATCLECGRPVAPQGRHVPGTVMHRARGLCGACWSRAYRNGTLERWPRLTAATGLSRRRRDLCVSCERLRVLQARDLCDRCRKAATADGTIEDWPTVWERRTAALIEDTEFLLEQGVTPGEIAVKLGYRPEALGRRLWRAGRVDLGRPLVTLGCRQRRAAKR